MWCVKSKAPGRDESLPYELNREKGFDGRSRAGHARPLQGGDGETGYSGRFRRGEGTPPYARVFKWGRRAASPLAAVEACGGGKVPGRDEFLPYKQKKQEPLHSGRFLLYG